MRQSSVEAGAVPVEGKDLPTVVLRELTLLLLEVLEIGQLVDAGEQPVEFLPDFASPSFNVRDPRELVRIEELSLSRGCARN